ncbi:MAG: hypothetical protein EXR86_12550 [Gammaproteobacteria bacterium]|nr:hypothetical protein [Gammaproteobacteria bacterium]
MLTVNPASKRISRLTTGGLTAILLWLALPAAARMYQWVDTVTGSVQLSGAPPAWYRSEMAGPRVLVIERGRTIDDTARAVEPTRSQALRAAAFDDSTARATSSQPATNASATPEPARASALDQPPPKVDQLEEFKALLEAWDREQSAAAASTLTPSEPPASSFTPPRP